MEITYEEIKTIFKMELNRELLEISPCGNHDLNRNLVFFTADKDNKWVIKFFYKPNKRIREIKSFQYFKQDRLTILAEGITKLGHEWLIYPFVEGDLLDLKIDKIPTENLIQLFEEIGAILGCFHGSHTFDYFGDWNVEKRSPVGEYRNFIIEDTERLIGNLQSCTSEESDIYQKAIYHVREEYRNIRQLEVGRLCHRDIDGRNIMITQNSENFYGVSAFLDFEKCVVFNEFYDITGLYRKYFLSNPYLIKPFKRGYERYLKIEESFNSEIKFNLLRLGIDLCSWSKDVSKLFYCESFNYLKMVLINYDQIDRWYL